MSILNNSTPNQLISKWDKPYQIIYADPSRKYKENWGNGSNEHTYHGETQEQILKWFENYKIVTDDNCFCYMWTTNPHLVSGEASEVMKYWGFEPKQILHWIKLYKNGKPEMGMGYDYRYCTESILFGKKGKPRINNKLTKNIFYAVNPIHYGFPHSTKPPVIRNMIEWCCGDIPRIELNARQRVQGWDAIGDQLPMEITQ